MRTGLLLPAALTAVALSAGTALAEIGSTTTINGSPAPGAMAPLAAKEVLLDSVQHDGNRLLVVQGVRAPGTRSPIQYHGFAGRTCVLTGTITHVVEGKQPASYPAGACYELPIGVAMTTANLGTQDVTLIDTFVAPADAPAIIVVEPGWPDLTDPVG